MKASDVLTLILIALVIIDIVATRIEIRRLREDKRRAQKKLQEPVMVEIKCVTEQFDAAIQSATDRLKKFAALSLEVSAQFEKAMQLPDKAQPEADPSAG